MAPPVATTRRNPLAALVLVVMRRRSPMGRGKPPSRSKQLAQGKGLKRGSRLSRQAPMPRGRVAREPGDHYGQALDSLIHGDVYVRSTGFPDVTRVQIINRDGGRCQRCGADVTAGRWPGYSLQHRDNRAMGGTSDPAINLPGNGLVLCGSGTTGCHGRVEHYPTEAEREGFAVASWADPTTVPVNTHTGWWLLDNDGHRTRTTPPPDGDAHAVAKKKEHRP